MKTFCTRSLALTLTLLLSGCFTTELIAPENYSVRLMPTEKPASFKKEYKNWYLFGGILPIYVTQPEELIAEQQLVEARVQTEDRISDGVITFVSSLIFLGLFPQTVVVEGNRAAEVVK